METKTITSERKAEIAKEIINQLGGNKFVAMTGSSNFLYGEDNGNPYLVMNLTSNKSKANRLKITLNAMDTYDLVFFSIRRKGLEIVKDVKAEINGAYCDMLTFLFTKTTGLFTSL